MTAEPPARFRDGDLPPRGDPDRWLVRCPRCDRRAVVTREPGMERLPAGELRPRGRLTCGGCGLARSQTLDGASWYAPVDVYARVRCSGCGRWLEATRRMHPRRRHARRLPLRCSGCGATTDAPAMPWRFLLRMPHDPFFGLPLWLQASCCGETLWAVDEGHLATLRHYVAAKLRERTPNVNASLPSRLPTWMKLARNRDEILACIDRLSAS
jgi:hypothetical protein